MTDKRSAIARWPVEECLHTDVEQTQLKNGAGQVIHQFERCLDCRAKRLPGGTWA